jgi:prevent-host-death family protein
MDPLANEFNIHEAKTHLSKIVERVERGEEIIIDRAGKPVAKIVPLPQEVDRTGFGKYADQGWEAEDWDSPETNEAIAEEWGL